MTELISVPTAAPEAAPADASLCTPGWADEVEKQSWRSLIVGLALLVDRLDQDLRRDHQLSFEEYTILSAVSDERYGMSLRAISQTHAVSRKRLAPVLARMQMAGWIQREVGTWHPDTRVWITPAGSALVDRAAPGHVAGLRDYLLDHVDPEEFQVMARAFHRLCNTLVNDPAAQAD